MGEDAFVAAGDEVGLSPRVVRSDVGEFEEAVGRGDLERAAEVYRGPFLDGFSVSDAPEFERWAEAERDRLAAAHTRALECLAETCEREGRPRDAAAWWRRLAAQDPFNSRVGTRLMRALDAAGERAAALWFAESHVAFLREELGVEPEDDFAALVRRLRSEPVAVPPAPPLAPAAVPPSFLGAGDRQATIADQDRDERAAGEGERAEHAAEAGQLMESAAGSEERVETVVGRGETVESAAGSEVPAESATVAGETVVIRGETAESAARSGERVEIAAGGGGERVESAAGARGGEDGAGDWERGTDAADPPAVVMVERRAAVAAGTQGDPRSRGRKGRLRMETVAAILSVLAGLLLSAQGRAPENALDPRYDPRRIAVLYFDDDSPRGDLGYLASGLTEMLIHELSQVPALEVITRSGVKPYRQRMVPLDSMQAALRVGSVVAGSVQRAGDSVRVTVQLVNPATQTPLDSRVIVRALDDVPEMQALLAREVSAILRRRVGREIQLREVNAGTHDGRALELVLRAAQAREDALVLQDGRDAQDSEAEVRLLRHADSLLARAEERDPRWARPTLMRGWTALRLADLSPPARHPALHGAAAEFAERVLAREPRSPEALELRGRARWRQGLPLGADPRGARLIREAERDLRAAVAARPALATALATLSQLLLSQGRFAEADLAARQALAADAYLDDAMEIHQQLFFSALMAGNHAAAGEVCGRARQAFPRDWRFVECRLTLMREQTSAPPDAALAWRLVAELDRLDPPAHARAEGRPYAAVYRRMVAASLSARAGDAARARSELDRARAWAAGDKAAGMELAYDEAYLLLALGDREAARRRLDAYLAARPALRPFLARDPLFRGLVSPAPPGRS